MKYWGKIIVLLITIAVLLFGIPLSINEAYKLETIYITNWDAADVLAFYSVILSGIITIFALIVTMRFTREDTEKQLKYQRAQFNVPFFVIDKVHECVLSPDFSIDGNQTYTKCYQSSKNSSFVNKSAQIEICLKNIGDGIALDPLCSSNTILDLDNDNYFAHVIPKSDIMKITFRINEIEYNTGTSQTDKIILSYKNTLGIVFQQEIRTGYTSEQDIQMMHISIYAVSPQQICI